MGKTGENVLLYKKNTCERARARVGQTCGHLVDERLLMLFIPRVEMTSGGACNFLHYIDLYMCYMGNWNPHNLYYFFLRMCVLVPFVCFKKFMFVTFVSV